MMTANDVYPWALIGFLPPSHSGSIAAPAEAPTVSALGESGQATVSVPPSGTYVTVEFEIRRK